MAIAPFVRQIRIADPARFDEQAWPALHRWLSDFMTWDRFADAMTKYAPWEEGDESVLFGAAPNAAVR
mgnify:CR=1 FL=1